MTLELSSPNKWAVRAGDTGAEIAKYRLKGILYWDRQAVPVWRWRFKGMTKRVRPISERDGYVPYQYQWHDIEFKPVCRWERRK